MVEITEKKNINQNLGGNNNSIISDKEYNEFEDSLVIDQYISSETNFMNKPQGIKLNQTSDFPHKGYSKIEIIEFSICIIYSLCSDMS